MKAAGVLLSAVVDAVVLLVRTASLSQEDEAEIRAQARKLYDATHSEIERIKLAQMGAEHAEAKAAGISD